jgi:outer membrane protein assembly factor BamB
VVTLTARSLVGVSFADGKPLWKVPAGQGMAYNSGTPIVDGDVVYVSGQGMGTMAVQVVKDGDKWTTKEKEGWKKSNVTATNFNTPLLKDGLMYAMAGAGGLGGGRGGPPGGGGRGGPPGGGGRGGPPGGGGRGGASRGGGPAPEPRAGSSNLICLDAKTGETKWTKEGGFGDCGGVFDAGTHLLALSNKSELCVLKPSATGYEEVAKYKVADTGVWALPILTGNRIIVKDRTSLTLWTLD